MIFLDEAQASVLFFPNVDYDVGSDPDSIAMGDFNEDGYPDLAVANRGSNDISILIGNGDGTCQEAVWFDAGKDLRYVVVGDFDEDGHLDLAVTLAVVFVEPVDHIAVYRGNGDGSFMEPMYHYVGEEYWLGHLVVGDFDENGHQDLAVTEYNPGGIFGAVSILIGNGDGTFLPAQNHSIGSASLFVTVGDFDEDGHQDLVVLNSPYDNLSIAFGIGDGTFLPEEHYRTGDGPSFASVVDFDADGHLDLAVSVDDSGDVSILINNVDGECWDSDCDGYLDEACGGDDCCDTDPAVNPGAREGPMGDHVCEDGIDNDCNGLIDMAEFDCYCADLDEDGHYDPSCGGDDCDDKDPDVNPGLEEYFMWEGYCEDGKDNDCDGDIDMEDDGCTDCFIGLLSTEFPHDHRSRRVQFHEGIRRARVAFIRSLTATTRIPR